MTNRLNKMQRSSGAFNEYTKKQKEGNCTIARISREEENQLMTAMKHVDQLKTSAKLQMAGVKVIDLKKKREELQQAQEEEKNARESALKRVQRLAGKPDANELGKSDCAKTNMNINYAIMQARE